MTGPASDSRIPHRMDFTMDVVHADDETRTAHIVIAPDPRRYRIVELDGKRFYLDKYLDYYIGVDDMNESMAQQMAGLPIFHLSPNISSTPNYAAARRAALKSDLRTGNYTPPEEPALPHRRFEENPQARGIAFLSIDICGSTAQRHADPEGFDRAYAILLVSLEPWWDCSTAPF